MVFCLAFLPSHMYPASMWKIPLLTTTSSKSNRKFSPPNEQSKLFLYHSFPRCLDWGEDSGVTASSAHPIEQVQALLVEEAPPESLGLHWGSMALERPLRTVMGLHDGDSTILPPRVWNSAREGEGEMSPLWPLTNLTQSNSRESAFSSPLLPLRAPSWPSSFQLQQVMSPGRFPEVAW